MTIVKQGGCSSKGHQNNLRRYINDDKKVLLRDSQNLADCKDIKRWASYMERTRRAFGHDVAARRVRDKKTGKLVTGKNLTMYHQIIAFNPDECDINGGTLSPESCMGYAKEYVTRYYPNQQAVFALHNEYCKEDGTHRYAVHIVINRTNLETGKRLDEGLSKSAKFKRAARIRDMDRRYGLKQVEKGERNSAVHKKQPSVIERMIAARGEFSYKLNLRELCRLAAGVAKNVYEYRDLLEKAGVDVEFRKGRMFVRDIDNSRYSFSLSQLDSDLGNANLAAQFDRNAVEEIRNLGRAVLNEGEAITSQSAGVDANKSRYLAEIREAYLTYRKEVQSMKGRPLAEIPKLKLKRPSADISTDEEIRRTVMAYWRGADELRVEVAGGVARAKKITDSMAEHQGSGNGQQRDTGIDIDAREKGRDGR